MILNNQNIMIYGSDEEKSLSVIGVTGGTFTVDDGVTFNLHVDCSDIKHKKVLVSVVPVVEGMLADPSAGSINFSTITLNLNENQYTHTMYESLASAAARVRQPLLEYYPSNSRGITFSVSSVPGEGPLENIAYYIAFIA
jgi:hypothetical protein